MTKALADAEQELKDANAKATSAQGYLTATRAKLADGEAQLKSLLSYDGAAQKGVLQGIADTKKKELDSAQAALLAANTALTEAKEAVKI